MARVIVYPYIGGGGGGGDLVFIQGSWVGYAILAPFLIVAVLIVLSASFHTPVIDNLIVQARSNLVFKC